MQGRKFRLQTEGSSGGLGPQVPSLVDGKSVAAENFSTGMLHLPGRKNFESQGCGREDDRQPRLCQRKSHFSHQRSEISCQQIARPGLGNRTRASIAICHCERQISSVALREKPDLGQDKLSWLQRHDQDCGALYGVLPPFAEYMQHINEKQKWIEDPDLIGLFFFVKYVFSIKRFRGTTFN